MAIATVKFTVNSTEYSAMYNGASGKWEATITAPGATSFNLPGGFYPVSARATNQAGTYTDVTTADSKVGNSLKLVVKETVAPVITIVSPGAGAHLPSSTPPITVQLRDETGGSGVKLSTFSLSLDGTNYNSAAAGMSVASVAGGYNITFTPQSALSDGPHTIAVSMSDNDGNAATQASRTFVTATTPPALNVTAPTDGLITADASLLVVGITNDSTAVSPASISIKLGGVDQGSVTVNSDGSFSKSLTLAEGANTIVVAATDLAAQTSSVTLSVTLDTSSPIFTSVTISPNPADQGATLIISAVVT
jgi:hypothetical protein